MELKRYLTVVNIIETGSRRLVAGGGRGMEIGELLFNECKVSIPQDTNSSGDGGWCCWHNSTKVLNTTEPYTSKWLRWGILCVWWYNKNKQDRYSMHCRKWVFGTPHYHT